MRFILLGPPGGGKGTQAHFIMQKYNIPQISTGDLLRSSIEENSTLRKEIKGIIDAGELVNDDLVIALVKERIAQKDCQNGFLLDGFPRTILQASTMKKENIRIDYVLEFCVPDELVVERVTGRRIHIASGRIYHVKYNPPKVTDRDDVTGEKLSFRKDDCENVVRKRLSIYHQITVPLISYYQREAKMGIVKYIRIDGTKNVLNIHEELDKILR